MTDATREAAQLLISDATHEPWEVEAVDLIGTLLFERDQARDEIERLRAEVARCEASLLAWVEAVGECNEDRNRLREALRAVEAKANQHRDDAVDDRVLEEAVRHESVSEIARAALAKETNHD